MAKMKLSERIEKLRTTLERERDRYEAGSSVTDSTLSETFKGYVYALEDVIAELVSDLSKAGVKRLLEAIQQEIESQNERVNLDDESPSMVERYERGILTQYKRLYAQVDNLLRDLPKDKSLEG